MSNLRTPTPSDGQGGQRANFRGCASLLEAANDELESFSYSVSHDLRAPLRNILGYIGMLREDAPGTINETVQQFLDKIRASAERMATLIDKLLQFSRNSGTELRLDPASLSGLVEEVIGDFPHEPEGRKVLWKQAPLPSVRGDVSMLRQVFVNALLNPLA